MRIRYVLLLLQTLAFNGFEAKECRPPVIPYSGTYVPNQPKYQPSDGIYYSCKKGFRIFGSDSRNCTTYGTWSKNVSYCGAALHGITMHDKKWNVLLDGNYSTCIGDTSVSLSFQYDGTFSEAFLRIYSLGNEGVDLYATINKKDCEKFENIEAESSFHESKCSFANAEETINITIVSLKSKGLCEIEIYPTKETKCSLLDTKANTSLQYEPDSNSRFVKYGTAALHNCSGDYSLVGERVRYCIDNGKWSGHKTYCQVVNCRKFKRINNGVIKYTNTSLHGMAYLYCDNGYDVQNEPHAICLKNSAWSNLELKCIETNTRLIVILLSVSSLVFLVLCIGGTIYMYKRKCKTKQKKSVLQDAHYYEYDASARSPDMHYYNTVIYEEIPESPRPSVPLPEIPVGVNEYALPIDNKTESVVGSIYIEPDDACKNEANTCPTYIMTDNLSIECKSQQRMRKAITLDEKKLQKLLCSGIVNNNENSSNHTMLKNDIYSAG